MKDAVRRRKKKKTMSLNERFSQMKRKPVKEETAFTITGRTIWFSKKSSNSLRSHPTFCCS
jgi:hypothetical protein